LPPCELDPFNAILHFFPETPNFQVTHSGTATYVFAVETVEAKSLFSSSLLLLLLFGV